MNCSKDGIKIEGGSCSYNNKCIYPKCITDMNKEYIIVNKTLLEDKIQELKNQKREHYEVDTGTFDVISMAKISQSIDLLTEILSQSTPLIPEIEKSMDSLKPYVAFADLYDATQNYMSNLKLDI